MAEKKATLSPSERAEANATKLEKLAATKLEHAAQLTREANTLSLQALSQRGIIERLSMSEEARSQAEKVKILSDKDVEKIVDSAPSAPFPSTSTSFGSIQLGQHNQTSK